MSDFNKRVNSVIVKNLPADFTENQLNELFSQCGQVNSTKVLPFNPNYDGGCGFVNFANAESCQQAVEKMNNYVIKGFTISVNPSGSPRSGNNNFDRPQNGFRTVSATYMNTDGSNGTPSPGTQSQFNGFRPASEQSSSNIPSKPIFSFNNQSNTNEVNTSKSTWNGSTSTQQSQTITNSNSPFQNGTYTIQQSMNIQGHEPFDKNKTYNVYLSNLQVPNLVFAATLDDYVNATLLITQMNKHEQLSKVQANSYKTKLNIGQICAAQFNKDWYRARILEIDDTRVRVQYIDWGNTGWCDAILEIRPLPNEYYKDPALCEKCILDGVPSNEKLSDQQANAILSILVLDVKLEMTVLRIENNIPYVRLNLGERNLNNEVRAIFSSSTTIKPNPVVNLGFNQPEIDLTDTHYVQLTAVDTVAECFHVLLMRDCIPTIMNVLKDWNASKQPLIGQPKSDTLVCAQYDADDLWYRAWIQKVTNNGVHVYFVDFGNEEIVPNNRLSECPDVLKNIPWQSVQIKLANIKLTDEERCKILKDFETERLEMKVLEKNQNTYLVELFNNGKSLIDHALNLRKQQQQQSQKIDTPIPKTITENVPQISQDNLRPTSQPIQPIVDTSKQPTLEDVIKKPVFSSTTNIITAPVITTVDQKNDTTLNDNLTTFITEQRRQNQLLAQVIAAINTTNALLTQLVQR